jgi:hypothetical protein
MIIPVSTTPVQAEEFGGEDEVLLINEGPVAVRLAYTQDEVEDGVLLVPGAGVITNPLESNQIWLVTDADAAQVSIIRVQ